MIFLRLFLVFLKIGAFTFGGGYAMIPLIEAEIINRRGWLARDEFMELLTLAQSSPGPIAINTSVFIGYKTRGVAGAAAAGMDSCGVLWGYGSRAELIGAGATRIAADLGELGRIVTGR